MKCEYCGYDMDSSSRFCPQCGKGRATASGGPPPTTQSPSIPHSTSRWRISRQFWIGLIAFVVIGIGVTGATLLWPILMGSGFTTASYVDANTWFYATATLQPGLRQSLKLNTLAQAFTSQPGWATAVDRLDQDMEKSLRQSNLDLKREVFARLDGEMAVALSGDTNDPTYVIILHSSDPEAIVKSVAHADGAPDPTFRYGNALRYSSTASRTFIAGDKHWLVMASDLDTLDAVVDRIEGRSQGSLAQTDSFRALLAQLPSDKLGYFYTNGARLQQLSQEKLGNTLKTTLPQSLQNRLAAMAGPSMMAVVATDSGLDFVGVQRPAGEIGPPIPHGNAETALDLLPEDTLVGVAQDSIMQLGLGDVLAADQQNITQSLPEGAHLDLTHWGMSDLALGLTRGTLAAGSAKGYTGMVGFYGALRVSNDQLARSDLASLDQQKAGKQLNIDGDNFTQAPLQNDVNFTYGVHQGWVEAAIGDPHAMIGASTTLAQNPRYLALKGAMGQRDGAVFVDLVALRQFSEGVLLSALSSQNVQTADYDTRVKPFIAPFQAFGGSWSWDDAGDTRVTYSLLIQK